MQTFSDQKMREHLEMEIWNGKFSFFLTKIQAKSSVYSHISSLMEWKDVI